MDSIETSQGKKFDCFFFLFAEYFFNKKNLFYNLESELLSIVLCKSVPRLCPLTDQLVKTKAD